MHKSDSVSPYRDQQRLVTRSTILILSGWFIGAATGQIAPAGNQDVSLLVGVTGLLAFLGLEYAARERKRLAAALSVGELAEKLQRRVHRPQTARPVRSVLAASSLRIREWLASEAPSPEERQGAPCFASRVRSA